MQHSPQEIKTILDRVVDSDGNVLDMAAVLEVVTILERLPITKEALEKTRLGKTINLLRKKTTNEELAKRAKGLVKKWQKLVINHLETLRNVDSPVNGNPLPSPQINGTLKETEKPESPAGDGAGKNKIIGGKKRGIKRKRGSCSSSENSPTVFVKSDDSESLPGTPNSAQDVGLGGQKSVNPLSTIQSKKKECITTVSQDNQSPISSLVQSSTSWVEGGEHLPSVATELQSSEDTSILSVDSGIDSQASVQRTEELIHEVQNTSCESVFNIDSLSESTANKDLCTPKNPCDRLTVSRSIETPTDEPSGVNCTSDIPHNSDRDNLLSGETMFESEAAPSLSPKELVLDVNVQANGVTGRYGGDGAWYNWTEVMPTSDGMLQVLPYVILE